MALVLAVILAMPAGAAPGSNSLGNLHGALNADRVPAGNDVVKGRTGAIDALFSEEKAVPAMIQVSGTPAALAAVSAARHGASMAQAGHSQKLQNDLTQQNVLSRITSAKIHAHVLYRVQSAYNGIAVMANGQALREISYLPGVVAVHRIALMTVNNANTQPLIGAPQAWESYGKTGTGIKIGIIDTGIDYTHTMFGGPGTTQALSDARSASNNVEVAGPSAVPPGYNVQSNGSQIYPSDKVVGGFDFAGDSYNAAGTGAALIPHPDANPEDCPSALGGGHGSHVSGTAAGYGVNSDGSTYTGPWNTSTPFDTMRIGPGVAPQASLYSLRVFGCTGSTALTTQAIDWAVDPNGDGNPADHLDVINLSLGSSGGTPDDPSAVSMDNATQAGVLAAVSAGNNNDVFYVSGSPGSATGAVTVASSVDTTDIVDGFGVSSPGVNGTQIASFSVNYNWPASSDLTAPLVYNVSGNTTGCSAFPAGSLTGMVVLVDWAPAGTSSFPCGSAVRANNAQNAGAVGIIMASGQTFFDTSISGNAGIRGVFTTNTVGNTLKSALASGTTSITFSYSYQGSQKFVIPGNDDTLSTFSSRGPRNRDNALKPDISAPGQSIFSTDAGTGTRGRSLSGTSMAAPHMAGTLALLKQANPTWSVAEIKALAMNTANHDLWTGRNQSGSRYGPARVGAGREDIPAALADSVVAYNTALPRAVSVSFGAVEVPAAGLTVDKSITVVNHSGTDAPYDISYDAITSIPGVSYSFPDGNQVTVPANGTTTFRVRLTADASQMHNSHDPTIALTQSSNPRQWLSEASGNVKLTPSQGPVAGGALRVPVYAAARPASQMTTSQSTLSFPGSTGSTSLGLTGTGVSTGAIGPNEHNSLVTPFELQGISPMLTSPPAGMSASALNADLQYIGATATPTQVLFGLTTWRDFNTLATDQQFSIFIDANRDGTDDYQLFTTRFTDSDVFVTALATLPSTSGSVQGFTNLFNANTPTAAMNNNIAVLPVNRSALAAKLNGSTTFNYRVEVSSRFNGTVDKFPSSGYLTYNFGSRGFDYSGGSSSPPVYVDMPGNSVPVVYNQANYLANNDLGTLLLHHYNLQGTRAQVIPVQAQITITAPASKTYGDDPFSVSGTASTGQTVSFSSRTPGTCSVSGTTVTILAAGTCTVRGSTPATTNFAAASADQDITIDKAGSSVTLTCPSNVTYTGSALTPCSAVVTGAGGLHQSVQVDYTNNTDAGTAGASATYAGDDNHTGSSSSTTFTIDKASSTTTVSCPSNVTYTGSALTPCSAVATGAGGLHESVQVDYTNNTDAGTAGASASYAGDSNHTGSSDSTTFTIDKASSTTTVTCPSHVTYAAKYVTPCSATATGAGGLNESVPVDYTNNRNVGTAGASATYAGDANHNGSSDSKTFTIDRAPLSITANDRSKYFGQAITLGSSAFSTSGLQGSDSVAGVTLTSSGVNAFAANGNHPIVPSAATAGPNTDLGNYSISYHNGTLHVVAVPLVGLTGVSVSSVADVKIDSFDSSLGAYGLPNHASNAVAGSNGSIALIHTLLSGDLVSTQDAITLSHTVDVSGDVTAGTTVTNGGTVHGTITQNAPQTVLSTPTVGSCRQFTSGVKSSTIAKYKYSPATGNFSVLGGKFTLANGTYCFNNLSVTPGATLVVNGPVTITLSGTLGGTGLIQNTTNVPGNLQIESTYSKANGVSVTGNPHAYMTIVAPGTDATIHNGAFFGTLYAGTATLTNGVHFHGDTH